MVIQLGNDNQYKIYFSMKDLLINKVAFSKIADFYLPQCILGKGSSAHVLLVKEANSNKKYAIKAIDKLYLQKTDQGIFAFKQEVKILKFLSELNTTKETYFLNLYNIFEGDVTYYLVIDLLNGKTLQEEITKLKAKQETFPQKIAKVIMYQLLKGVVLMHSNGIMHRDLKPDNIMFQTPGCYGTLRIVDVGLAVETDVPKYIFPKCGTPGYVAPEILNLVNKEDKYGTKCDIFSCGCIFYKLLTGSSLFSGTQFADVLKVNKQCEIDFGSSKIRSMSRVIVNLLEKMLSKDPKFRISAEEALKHEYFEGVGELLESEMEKEIHSVKNQTPKSNCVQFSGEKDSNYSAFKRFVFPKVEQKLEVNQQSFDEPSQEGAIQKMKIFPKFKRPSFTRSQKYEQFPKSPQRSLYSKRGSIQGHSIGTFYMKEPLSGIVANKNKISMRKVSLFEKQRQNEYD